MLNNGVYLMFDLICRIVTSSSLSKHIAGRANNHQRPRILCHFTLFIALHVTRQYIQSETVTGMATACVPQDPAINATTTCEQVKYESSSSVLKISKPKADFKTICI